MEYKEKIMELLDKIDTTAATPDGIVCGNVFLKRIIYHFGSMSEKWRV